MCLGRGRVHGFAILAGVALFARGVRCSEADVEDDEDLAAVAECVDRSYQCAYWAAIGECDANPNYMHPTCTSSCRLCPGDGSSRMPDFYRALEKKFVEPQPIPHVAEINEASFDPRVYAFDDFLTDFECEYLKDLAEPELSYAKVINQTTGLQQTDKVRTNQQMYASERQCREDEVLVEIIRRMHNLARAPYGHAEALQIGRYNLGQYYEPHFDSEPAADVIRSATVLVYLGVPGGGGETIFPKRKGCSGETFQGCCEPDGVADGGGIRMVPKKRQAMLFYSHDLDGRHNPFALHGSCPVTSGEKWVAQQWFRSKPFQGSPQYGLRY